MGRQERLEGGEGEGRHQVPGVWLLFVIVSCYYLVRLLTLHYDLRNTYWNTPLGKMNSLKVGKKKNTLGLGGPDPVVQLDGLKLENFLNKSYSK